MSPRLGQHAASVLALGVLTACHQQSFIPIRPSSPDSVTVGYGAQPRERVGGGVQSVTPEELTRIRVRRVEELLAGRFPGVQVLSTPGGGFAIRIRASASLSDRGPLYVIDGLPVEVAAGQGLDWLDPGDIAHIDILRDPAETSMFGGRGANGVVLIRTKSPSRP